MIKYCPSISPVYKRSGFKFKQSYGYKKYTTFDVFRSDCRPYFLEHSCSFPSMTILPLHLSAFITFCSCQSSFTIPLVLEQVWGDHISKLYFSSCNKDCKRYIVIPFYSLPHDIQLTILAMVFRYTNCPCTPCPENFQLWMAVSAAAQISFGSLFGSDLGYFSAQFVLFCLSKYYQACDLFKNTKGILPILSQEPQIWTDVCNIYWHYFLQDYDCFFRNYFPSTDLYVQKIYDVYNHRLIVEVST